MQAEALVHYLVSNFTEFAREDPATAKQFFRDISRLPLGVVFQPGVTVTFRSPADDKRLVPLCHCAVQSRNIYMQHIMGDRRSVLVSDLDLVWSQKPVLLWSFYVNKELRTLLEMQEPTVNQVNKKKCRVGLVQFG